MSNEPTPSADPVPTLLPPPAPAPTVPCAPQAPYPPLSPVFAALAAEWDAIDDAVAGRPQGDDSPEPGPGDEGGEGFEEEQEPEEEFDLFSHDADLRNDEPDAALTVANLLAEAEELLAAGAPAWGLLDKADAKIAGLRREFDCEEWPTSDWTSAAELVEALWSEAARLRRVARRQRDAAPVALRQAG